MLGQDAARCLVNATGCSLPFPFFFSLSVCFVFRNKNRPWFKRLCFVRCRLKSRRSGGSSSQKIEFQKESSPPVNEISQQIGIKIVGDGLESSKFEETRKYSAIKRELIATMWNNGNFHGYGELFAREKRKWEKKKRKKLSEHTPQLAFPSNWSVESV